jgi:hypothetical protein
MNDESSRAEKRSDSGNDEGSTWGERLLMATSAIFTIVLFAFVI